MTHGGSDSSLVGDGVNEGTAKIPGSKTQNPYAPAHRTILSPGNVGNKKTRTTIISPPGDPAMPGTQDPGILFSHPSVPHGY